MRNPTVEKWTKVLRLLAAALALINVGVRLGDQLRRTSRQGAVDHWVAEHMDEVMGEAVTAVRDAQQDGPPPDDLTASVVTNLRRHAQEAARTTPSVGDPWERAAAAWDAMRSAAAGVQQVRRDQVAKAEYDAHVAPTGPDGLPDTDDQLPERD